MTCLPQFVELIRSRVRTQIPIPQFSLALSYHTSPALPLMWLQTKIIFCSKKWQAQYGTVTIKNKQREGTCRSVIHIPFMGPTETRNLHAMGRAPVIKGNEGSPQSPPTAGLVEGVFLCQPACSPQLDLQTMETRGTSVYRECWPHLLLLLTLQAGPLPLISTLTLRILNCKLFK